MARKSKVKLIIDVFASRVSLLLLGALTAWLGYSVARESYGRHRAQAEIEALKQEILDLENKNSGLSSLINSFEDPGNVELEAKRRLNLKKPGEEVAVILRSPEPYDSGRDKNDDAQNIAQANNYDIVGGDSIGGGYPVIRPGEGSRDSSNPLKWWQYITSGGD